MTDFFSFLAGHPIYIGVTILGSIASILAYVKYRPVKVENHLSDVKIKGGYTGGNKGGKHVEGDISNRLSSVEVEKDFVGGHDETSK